jgi:hypothetical protein
MCMNFAGPRVFLTFKLIEWLNMDVLNDRSSFSIQMAIRDRV